MAIQDDELMFAIGVTSKAGIKKEFSDIAKLAEETQKKLYFSVQSVGSGAQSVKGQMVGLTDHVKAIGQLKAIASEPISVKIDTSSIDEISQKRKHSVEQLNAWEEAETVKRFNEAKALEEQYQAWRKANSEEHLIAEEKAFIKSAFRRADAAAAAERQSAKQSGGKVAGLKLEPIKLEPIGVGDMFAEAELALDNFRAKAAEHVEVDFGLPKNLKNVFMQFEGVSLKSVDTIGEALDKKVLDLAKPASIATTQIRQEYQKRVADHAKAYSQMSEQMDRAVDRQTAALERQESAIKKSARGMIEGAKGFMQLGLLSQDSSEKILKSLVAIEGAVNLLEGGIDVMQSFTQGLRAMKQATQAGGKVAELSKGMAGLSKVGSMLGVGANVASGATAVAGVGSMLGAGSGAIGLGSGAVGVGAGVGGVGAGAVGVGAGGLGVGAAGASVAAIAIPAAAAAAALAAVSLVAVELKETFSGTATKAGSVTDSIGSFQVSMVSGAMRMTGMFERTDSIGTQLATGYSKLLDATAGQIPVIGQVVKGLNVLGDAANLAASYAAVERSQKLLAVNKIKNEQRDKLDNVERDAGFEIAGNTFKNRVQSVRGYAELGSTDDKLKGEMQIQALAAKELAMYQRQAADAAETQGRTSEKYRDSISQVKSIQDQITDSYHRQKGLVAEKARTEIQSQSQVMEGLKRQLETTKQGIESVKGSYKSAAINFAKLDIVDQKSALDAMSQAKTKGAGSLDERQRDLLRSVGGEEATGFADQADMMEAGSRGFDKQFKSGFESKLMKMEAVERNIEANIQTQYTANVKVDFDSKGLERMVTDQINKIMDDRNKEVTLAVQENLSLQKQKISDETVSRLSMQKANK